MKNEDTKKNKLQKINDLFFIDKFVSTVNFKINRELAEIEIKVKKQ